MAKEDENKSEVEKIEKSIDELAREAMDAIQESDKQEERREENEAIEKENALKLEVENKLKKKLRRLMDSQKKEDEKTARLEEENDSRFIVSWKNPDEKGLRYEGVYNDELAFKITRGFNVYHLYVVDKEIRVEDWKRKSHTSIDLYTLKKKADKILSESIKIIEEENKSKK